MANTEFEAKNLDVAVWNASQELDIPIEKLRYKVVAKGKRAVDGAAGEPARIQVLLGDEPMPVAKVETPAPEPVAETVPEPVEVAAEPEPDPEPEAESEPEEKVEAAEPEAPADETPEVEAASDADADETPEVEAASDADADSDAGSDDDDLDDEDLDEPPSSSATTLEDDDPIEMAREARRRRARQAVEVEDAPEAEAQASESDDDADNIEEEAASDSSADDHEPDDDQSDATDADDDVEDEPVAAAAPREERQEHRERRDRDHRDDRDERPRREGGSRRSRRPSRERPRPEGALDPDDLEAGLAKAKEMVPSLIEAMGFDLEVGGEIQEDHVYIPLQGEDSSYLLDHRAEGLNALQFLINKMVYRGGPTRILVDADGYRKQRQEELVERARDLADEVRDGARSRSLGSLNPFERRLVHMALRDDEDVRTVSKGEGFLKRMEIMSKDGGNDSREPERRGRSRDRY